MTNGMMPVMAPPIGRCVLGTSGIRDESGYRMLDQVLAAFSAAPGKNTHHWMEDAAF